MPEKYNNNFEWYFSYDVEKDFKTNIHNIFQTMANFKNTAKLKWKMFCKINS